MCAELCAHALRWDPWDPPGRTRSLRPRSLWESCKGEVWGTGHAVFSEHRVQGPLTPDPCPHTGTGQGKCCITEVPLEGTVGELACWQLCARLVCCPEPLLVFSTLAKARQFPVWAKGFLWSLPPAQRRQCCPMALQLREAQSLGHDHTAAGADRPWAASPLLLAVTSRDSSS